MCVWQGCTRSVWCTGTLSQRTAWSVRTVRRQTMTTPTTTASLGRQLPNPCGCPLTVRHPCWFAPGHLALADFGTAVQLQAGQTLTDFAGTYCYVAPEMLTEPPVPYAHEVDLWTFGIVLFEMLVGYRPFNSPNPEKLKKLVRQNPVRAPHNMDYIPTRWP